MVMRIDVVMACGIQEQLADRAEGIVVDRCGLNEPLDAQFRFVTGQDNWQPREHHENYGALFSVDQTKFRICLLRMRHYLAGRIALDIVDCRDPELRVNTLPNLVKLINDLEAELKACTSLLGFFYRYSRRVEEERKQLDKRKIPDPQDIPYGC